MLDISTPVPNIKEFSPGAMNKIVVRVNLRENSEVFNFEFSVLSTVRKWKTRSWKTSEFDQCASEKTPRFSTPSFRFWVYSAKWKTRSWKPPSSINVPQRKLRGFQLRVLGIVQNGKLQVGKPIL